MEAEDSHLDSGSHWMQTIIEEFHAEYKKKRSELDSIVPAHFWNNESAINKHNPPF
jgi:hypothetical protein